MGINNQLSTFYRNGCWHNLQYNEYILAYFRNLDIRKPRYHRFCLCIHMDLRFVFSHSRNTSWKRKKHSNSVWSGLNINTITFAFQEFIFQIGGFDIKHIFDSAVFLNSPILAVLYLGIPYFVMIGIEIRSRKKNKKMKLKKMPSQKGNNQKDERRDSVVSRDDLGINSEDRIFFSDSM